MKIKAIDREREPKNKNYVKDGETEIDRILNNKEAVKEIKKLRKRTDKLKKLKDEVSRLKYKAAMDRLAIEQKFNIFTPDFMSVDNILDDKSRFNFREMLK